MIGLENTRSQRKFHMGDVKDLSEAGNWDFLFVSTEVPSLGPFVNPLESP